MVDKKVTKQVKASLQENVTYLNSILPVSESFDLIPVSYTHLTKLY